MSKYKTMNKAELKAAAEALGVEVEEGATNKQIAEALEKASESTVSEVQEESENKSEPVAAPQPEESKDEEEPVVVRMISKNASYTVGKYKFTHKHPFHAIDPDLANYLVSTGRFSIATKEELKEYYSE